jgi:hypothetical protein
MVFVSGQLDHLIGANLSRKRFAGTKLADRWIYGQFL